MRAYKTEIKPTVDQSQKINNTIGVCRYLYNLYLATNKEQYAIDKTFISGFEFDKWVNNVYSLKHPWIKAVSSKARKQSIMNAHAAFINFFNGKSKFPKFKKKNKQRVKAYFPKNGKAEWTVERHRIKIPTIGFVRLKEFGYIPTNAKITGGRVSQKADRYFVSVTVDEKFEMLHCETSSEGIGIDLGLKTFAVVSNNPVPFKNINKTSHVKKLEKQLKRSQRKLSRKFENKKKKGGKTALKNIGKQLIKVQKLHHKLTNIRSDYVNKTINTLVKTKPEYITIEDLNVKGMMKNRHLSKAIQKQKFSEFRTKLTLKCKTNNIELRLVSRWYPSSKLCSDCGNLKKDLKLSDRVYRCEHCGLVIDRDENASINLANAKEYKIV